MIALVIFAAAFLALVWLGWMLRCPQNRDHELLALSALLVLSLLPVYHRLYDAALLIFPLAWSLKHIRNRNRIAWAALILILVFLVPGGSVLELLQKKSHFTMLAHSWFWIHFVMPHQIWALLALSLLLITAMRNAARVNLMPAG